MTDDLGKKMETFGRNIWQKTQKTIDIVSLNNDIGTKERRLTQLYADIGEAYCKAHIEDAQTEFPEICEEAFSLTREIASLKASVLRIKGYRTCAACQATVDVSAAYCPQCGAAMPEPETPEALESEEPETPERAQDVCGACGMEMEDEDGFCQNCGEKREEA